MASFRYSSRIIHKIQKRKQVFKQMQLPCTWKWYEKKLRYISKKSPNNLSAGFYYDELAKRGLLPPKGSTCSIQAMQELVNEKFQENYIKHKWTSYTCSHLQHNDWADFAAGACDCKNVEACRCKPTLVQFTAELVETCVADEEFINVVGYFSSVSGLSSSD